MSSDDGRPSAYQLWAREAMACTRCAELARARTRVVTGAGSARAGVLFVGDAPGHDEDRQGLPLVGRADRLLSELLAEVGIARADVFVTTAVKCRPPDNRDPTPGELARCLDHLHRQVELLRPRVVCPLGSVATKLLRGDQAPVTRVRGTAEVVVLGTRAVRLLPLLHPAAALYRPETVQRLRDDLGRLPGLLALPAPDGPPAPVAEPVVAGGDERQLGLF